MNGQSLKPHIAKVAGGQSLTREEAREAFGIIMSGEATPSQIGGFLMGLRVRGETVDEIAGAVETMRAKMLPVEAPADAIDIVGTGGDNSGTYNISSCTAFVVAGCGVPVAKHGNRALSSKSGAADVLGALGIDIDVDASTIARCIREAGLGFMFAPNHHSAMKHVGPSRVELGTRTIFNILGPLSNPARTRRQLIGVYHAQWLEPIARTLAIAEAERIWVVHGSDGLDEITTTGPTHVAEMKGGEVRRFTIAPEDAGLPLASPGDLKGGDAEANATAIRSVLDGDKGPFRDIVVLNAAAALIVAGKAGTLREGAEMAARSIDEGAALDRLTRLVAASNA
ncbi:anthranilate phosphoribosyltransferase [Lutibaculum baratangense]|uniref:Anthranilate phosphoribosyltransferase n=1 Tax=Lutibaculum baratangense AMV1 TaxID=631454 RepID=V4RDP2_9HYPH|nr:anthranilate phosphoribosyltransferase [Lutibaculum baratangense]ESR23489.1 Anthranilate phosphoribosyltransferase [Lutibaculum baratangense AMV1]